MVLGAGIFLRCVRGRRRVRRGIGCCSVSCRSRGGCCRRRSGRCRRRCGGRVGSCCRRVGGSGRCCVDGKVVQVVHEIHIVRLFLGVRNSLLNFYFRVPSKVFI